ncbi:DUF4952 domain-containing protein [Achromobacter seleniivolatilans]|uniref:DUF4952 domain-containing protein n=1 Tax=Achromobacter seleniivolatilans TaxID=3047478 RepID=A0ABY9M985_9BURK|nr:DUF4952 domain-containing protein [Achromobacter sp. R39]WMD22753.1 DUF4952 domain-containing protein [Achromobacter sp. R39]
MTLNLRVARVRRAWVVPLCLLMSLSLSALAASAAEQTMTPTDALANWEAEGRAMGLARPDIQCQDFLQTLGKKPDYVEYLGCEQDDDSYIQPMDARYQVSGASAVQMEAYLMQNFGMPRLVHICCGWSPGKPYFWKGPDGVAYEISMGAETFSYPREEWHKIASFGVTIGVIRKSP